jgi:putative oxidoreductase
MMKRLTSINQDLGLLLLRLGFGPAMMVHGIQKLNKFAELSGSFPDPIGVGSYASLCLAIFAELVCSILLILGLLTPFALAPLIVTMLVAMFIIHGDDPWGKQELAFLYLAFYGGLFFTGPGRYSLDHKIFGGKSDDGSS